MSSEGLAGILGAPRGVLRGQEAMDLIAYGCSRGLVEDAFERF